MAIVDTNGSGATWAGSGFQTTHWSLVLTAGRNDGPESFKALEKLCTAYWYPLYAFVRRRGYAHAEAQDLTQAFFERLLEKEGLSGLSRDGGRFRSFLLKSIKNFLINQWNHQKAQKNGGGKKVISIDDTAEIRYRKELADHATPETLYERQWALTVLDHVFAALREEYRAAGKLALFEALQGGLPGVHEEQAHRETAKALNMKAEAVRMAACRLRRRYGELLRSEIAATVSRPEEVDQELQHLISVLGK